jgi:putative tricarboxylic transport membrane protein
VKKVDIFVGLLLIVLSIATWITAGNFPSVGDTDVGAGFFPRLIASILLVLSLILIASGYRRRGGGDEETGQTSWKRTLLGFVCTFAFLALICLCGFFLSTPVFLLGFMWLLGYRKPVPTVAVAVLVTLFIYLVFEKVLQVPLPAGLFFE